MGIVLKPFLCFLLKTKVHDVIEKCYTPWRIEDGTATRTCLDIATPYNKSMQMQPESFLNTQYLYEHFLTLRMGCMVLPLGILLAYFDYQEGCHMSLF